MAKVLIFMELKCLKDYLFDIGIEILGATESEGKGFSNGLWKPDSHIAQPLVYSNRVYKRIFISHVI
ncbi:hypothetical protein [uncultured Parabacteroides sp.]|jgi:hypothetical protein|uniref:hypothetical protein n=1 Tax=uncultured Parabacteroides sp. TaxID=512312 RepID=UPI0025F671EC|nr:hypothetical protein [uncultured Parabacteroides sp.]